METFLFIGVGNMGSAILGRAVERGAIPAAAVSVFDTDSERLAAAGRLGVRTLGSLDAAEAGGFDFVLVCVKPKDVASACAKASGLMKADGLLVSIAAGISIASVEKALGRPAAVCRVMPNINILSGSGASALSFNAGAAPGRKKKAMDLFAASGLAVEIEESRLHAVTGLSGSGPAYAALFISALTDGGVKSGLSNADAYALALQTVGGTVETLRKLGCVPEQLKNMVSSPGGTTIDAVHSLEKNRFRAAVIEAVETAAKKSALLGKAGEKK